MPARKMPILAFVMVTLTGLSTLLLGTFAVYDQTQEDTRLSAALGRKLDGQAERLALSVALPIWNFDLEQVERILNSLMDDPEVQGLDLRLDDKQKTRYILGRGADGRALKLSAPPQAAPRLTRERTVFHAGERVGALSLFGSEEPKRAQLRKELRRHLFAILALDLGLVALLYAVLWSSILKPLKRMEDFTGDVAAGKPGARLELSSDLQEIQRLSDSLRSMLRLLDERYESLQKSEAVLRQAQKLESVGQLAGGVAHDFNNILQLILTCCELARQELPEGHPALAELNTILEGGQRGTKLVRQLLQFSRRQVLEPRDLRMDQLVEGMQEMLRRLLGERIRLEARFHAEAGVVRVDPGHFEQMLLNLCLNARDAMPEGGRLLIEVSGAHLTASEAESHAGAHAGPYVVLSVTDEGHGFGPEVMQHLFEPFFSTKPQGKGTGLGLATCFGIASQANGFISVGSKPGQGSTFKVWLPRVEEAAKPFPPEAMLAKMRQRTDHPSGSSS